MALFRRKPRFTDPIDQLLYSGWGTATEIRVGIDAIDEKLLANPALVLRLGPVLLGMTQYGELVGNHEVNETGAIWICHGAYLAWRYWALSAVEQIVS
jgi:hypothetical protein